jgi:hypothetical protein
VKYFLDTEFYEDGKTIDLISIGIVAEDGREFYRCNQEARLDLVSPWVRTNVLPSLPKYDDAAWATRRQIRDDLMVFFNEELWADIEKRDKSKFQLWAYYADYDWVVFCQLFGTMMQLPETFPKFCMDLKQLSVNLGNPKHPSDPEGEHNALVDARWNRDLYTFLMNYRNT